MITNSLVKIKDHPPFTPELEGSVLLNPLARVTRDKAGELSFPAKLAKAPSANLANLDVLSESLGKAGDSAGVGVDHGRCYKGLAGNRLTFSQSSFPQFHRTTLPSWNATSHQVKFPIANPSLTRKLHLQLDGLARRLSSSR